MDLLYRIIIYLHVASVIASIGPFFILMPIVKKLPDAVGRELEAHLALLKSVVRMSKHAGHVLIGSGVLLVILGPWTWKTPWIIGTLALLFASLFFLARAFSPTLRKFAEEGANKIELSAKLKRTIWTYIILLMSMLWFMVVKPNLW
ncbi:MULTISPECIES: hypothetical protein [unclassified Mesobacillus]|uniref:hypothetical protein n=1 Tax=unclassified Mesobacillus TaxID=2675270 RepID=UPI00203E1B3A|nr:MULTISPECIES: hypothetical protein [unclassified Mesobacillus]MCM3125499.1 hypothetical protein [Mesobacillus sp. MER 33]MCM3234457.1 hypothetical protein [Mesobacillus sp. MER 48]